MQYLQLQSLWPDWQQQLQQTRLQKVLFHGPQCFSLQGYAQTPWWGVCDFSQGKSLFFVSENVPTVLPRIPAQGFVMALRKYLVGLRLVSLEQRPGDRWLGLVFANGDGEHWHLVLELSGRHGNAFLLNPAYQVLISLRPDRSQRHLRSGQGYVPPVLPTQGLLYRPDPLHLADLPLGERAPLFARLQIQAYAAEHQQQVLRSLQQRLENRLAQNQKQQARWLQDLDLQAKAQWELWAMQLQAAFANPPLPGATWVEVPDYAQENQPLVRVPLQPHLTLAENIARYYQRAKKAARRAAYAEAHLPKIWEHIEQDQALRIQLQQGQALLKVQGVLSPEQWQPWQTLARPLQQSHLPKATPQGPRGSAVREHARGFVLGETLLWVGKSDRDNHALTFRYGKGRDGWCHVQDTSGSHVLCKAPWNTETLKAAAHLAAYYSPQRQAFLRGQTVSVSYTQVKYVKALKGARPGRVQLQQFKSYGVKYDADFWEALHA